MSAEMTRADRIRCILIALIAGAGALLSVFLIQEFYGAASAAIKSVCTSSASGVNSCRTVAESAYSGLRNLPFIGEIPVALLGFVFYGFIFVLSAARVRFAVTESAAGLYAFILPLSLLAIIGDAVLFIISVYVIRAVCPLCSYTYIATVIIFGLALHGYAASSRSMKEVFLMSMRVIQKRFGFLSITVALLLAGGLALSVHAKQALEREYSSDKKNEKLKAFIEDYRKTRPRPVDYEGAPRIGSLNAPVKIAVFIDFTCSHCMQMGQILDSLAASYKDRIVIIYKNYPLEDECFNESGEKKKGYTGACFAAAGSLCGHEQNLYRPMYKSLYDFSFKGGIFTSASILKLAKQNGADEKRFSACMASEATRNRVRNEIIEGDTLGVAGTPTVFINGREVKTEYQSETLFRGLIEYLTK